MEGESFSQELQQMHSLLFKSGEAISSLKEELLDMKDSKLEARAKCVELQAAHDSLLEQQRLYQELLASADKQVGPRACVFVVCVSGAWRVCRMCASLLPCCNCVHVRRGRGGRGGEERESQRARETDSRRARALIDDMRPEQHQRLQAEVDSLQDERNTLRLALARRDDASSENGGEQQLVANKAAGADKDVAHAPAELLENVSGNVMVLMDQMGELLRHAVLSSLSLSLSLSVCVCVCVSLTHTLARSLSPSPSLCLCLSRARARALSLSFRFFSLSVLPPSLSLARSLAPLHPPPER